MNIDRKKLAEEIQKAKFKGKPASEVLKELQAEADANAKSPKVNAPVAKGKQGEAEKSSLIGKAKSFAESTLSRGIANNKATPETISLRVLSCHGDPANNLPPCPRRMDSKNFKNSHYCGACGCGDKQMTQLTQCEVNGKMIEYTKIHYPKVTCPLMMPGFTNYKSCAENEKTSNDRKQFIEFKEGVDYIKVQSTPAPIVKKET